MKKIGLFLITLFVTFGIAVVSCTKTVKIPISFSVVTNHQDKVTDIYVPDHGTYDMQIMVKFLSGYASDNVTLKVVGLPADITVSPDTFSAVPTYVEDFVFTTTNAAHATYPVAIIATAPGVAAQTYNFNLTVISADCAANLWGAFSVHNACAALNYNYTATGVATGTTNTLTINNFGGYGAGVNAQVILNCDNDSLTIPNQNMGNGVVAQGYGVFTANSMTIWYSASSTPTGGPDNCSATFTR